LCEETTGVCGADGAAELPPPQLDSASDATTTANRWTNDFITQWAPERADYSKTLCMTIYGNLR
jgi:hypothetical protein